MILRENDTTEARASATAGSESLVPALSRSDWAHQPAFGSPNPLTRFPAKLFRLESPSSAKIEPSRISSYTYTYIYGAASPRAWNLHQYTIILRRALPLANMGKLVTIGSGIFLAIGGCFHLLLLSVCSANLRSSLQVSSLATTVVLSRPQLASQLLSTTLAPQTLLRRGALSPPSQGVRLSGL